MAEHARVIRVSRFVPAAGRRAELIAVLGDVAQRVRSLEGCFGVQVCEVSEDPRAVMVVSRWSSAEVVAKLPIDQVRARTEPLIAEPTVTEHLVPL